MEQLQLGSQDMGKQEWAETFNIQFICNSVVDPDPDQTLKGVLSPDPPWIFFIICESPPRESCIARQDRTLFLKL